MTIVDIGVACSNHQTADWWAPIMSNLLLEQSKGLQFGTIFAISSALPDHNKNNTVQKRRSSLTDANRGTLATSFLEGKSDWLFQIDDDTTPPYGTISKLIEKGRAFIGGLYFLPGEPHNPIAYYKQPDGLYFPVWNYPEGALIEIDAIGMGCTLIHRSVFEKIQVEHEQYQRPDGSLLVVHKSQIKNRKPAPKLKAFVKNGMYTMPVSPRSEDDNRPFPFYALEYGRTEDFHFCELAANVGIKPWLDTTIICNHFKAKPTNEQQYKDALAKGLEP